MLNFIKGLFKQPFSTDYEPTDKSKAVKSPSVLYPECLWLVTVSDLVVHCQRPNGLIEKIEWSDLQQVIIETTNDGPFTADVFWLLVGSSSGCIIPQGATGEPVLIEYLQKLPQFNNDALIDAMSSTSNAKFICWQREPA